MLKKRTRTGSRSALRPLACLSACALITSTLPAYAQSTDDLPTPFAYGAEATDDPSDSQRAVDARAALPKSAVLLTAPALMSGAAASDAARPSAASAPPPPLAKDDGAGLRIAGYVAGGVGIAGFVLFAVAGIAAKNAHDRLDEACNAGRCDDASRETDIENGKLMQTAANIGLATGLTGIGLGATLIVLGGHSANDAAPAVGMSGRGGLFTVAGRF